MFLEFCWPKELKQAIAECREKGVLNEEAVQYLHGVTKKYFVIWAIVSLVTFFFINSMIGAFLFCALPVAIRFDLKKLYNKQMEPYVYGKKTQAILRNLTRCYAGRQKIFCESLDTAQEIVCEIGTKPDINRADLPEKREKVFIYQSMLNKRQAMPDISYIKQKRSLTTEILEAAEYASDLHATGGICY